MFTGITQNIGESVYINKKANIVNIGFKCGKFSDGAAIGESIAVNGVCLTVSSKERDVLFFDVSDETLKSTNLKDIKLGTRVNLEKAMAIGDRLGGHIVTGHVDGIGIIKTIEKNAQTHTITISAPETILKYIVSKGSIAIDGISLTVQKVHNSRFTLVIIPHTLKETTLANKQIGDKVNLEADIIGKYVEKLIEPFINKNISSDNTLLAKLKEEGYLK
ncbi:Lumazine-binding protein [Candidatus Magnetoovum chiemensis]|nr:Lumazine-binding protein [Candidatus Magnetoovum chiemensis]